MSEKKIKIPKIDLSKYCGQERLDSTVEQMILQCIIAFDCDINKVKKQFNITDDTVDKVFIKYFTQLNKIINSKNRNTDADDSLETVLKLYHDHVDEVAKIVNSNQQTKLLSDRVVRNINTITDRLIEIKEQNSKAYDTTINKLNDQIVKLKTLEKMEHGEMQDNTEYHANSKTVAERMLEYAERYDNNKRRCTVTNTANGDSKTFESITEAAKFFGSTPSHFYNMWNSKRLYRKVFRIEIEDK